MYVCMYGMYVYAIYVCMIDAHQPALDHYREMNQGKPLYVASCTKQMEYSEAIKHADDYAQ